jgi:predicted transcriptional regulator
MTKDEIAGILDRVAELPQEAHDELIESVARIEAKYAGVYRLDEEERAALDRSLEDLQKGRFASPEKIDGILSRHRGR